MWFPGGVSEHPIKGHVGKQQVGELGGSRNGKLGRAFLWRLREGGADAVNGLGAGRLGQF